MKRISLILAMAMVLLVAFTASAMAAGDGGVLSTNLHETSMDTRLTTTFDAGVADPGNHGTNAQIYLPGNPSTDGTRIHANYKENTDACAACHFTHTAPGKRLLQWNGIFKTCAACHDGSLGDYTYDVFAGKIGTGDARTWGGLFGAPADYQDEEGSLSNHMPDGYVALSAAPGAKDNALENTGFDCASCHTPHGQGGNARILSPDPWKQKISKVFTTAGTNRGNNVNQFAYDLSDGNSDGIYKDSTDPDDQTDHWIEGYPYNKITVVVNTSSSASGLTFNFNDSGNLTVEGGTILSSNYYDINYYKGEVTFKNSPPAGNKVIVRVPGIFVAMKISGYMTQNEDIEYVATKVDDDGATSGIEGINAYCGACHGWYNTQGRTADSSYDWVTADDMNHGSGQFADDEGMYRHQVGLLWQNQWTGDANYIKFAYEFDKTTGEVKKEAGDKKVFTCLGCHFAHGTNSQYWSDQIERVNGDSDANFSGTLDETYGSSALKRLPDMGTCENCHNKSAGNAKDTYDVNGAAYTYY